MLEYVFKTIYVSIYKISKMFFCLLKFKIPMFHIVV